MAIGPTNRHLQYLSESSQLGSCKGDPVGISSLLLEVAQRAVRKELINSYQLSRSVVLICDLLLSTALRRCTDHKSMVQNATKHCGTPLSKLNNNQTIFFLGVSMLVRSAKTSNTSSDACACSTKEIAAATFPRTCLSLAVKVLDN